MWAFADGTVPAADWMQPADCLEGNTATIPNHLWSWRCAKLNSAAFQCERMNS